MTSVSACSRRETYVGGGRLPESDYTSVFGFHDFDGWPFANVRVVVVVIIICRRRRRRRRTENVGYFDVFVR